MFLRQMFPKIPVYTFDIIEHKQKLRRKRLYKKHDINYFIGDVFISTKIHELLKSDKKILLLCDGGHKINEFTYFAPLMKKGDIIGMHDFAINRKSIIRNAWTSCIESTEDDIKHFLGTRVKRYRYFDAFLVVVWGMYIKL